LEERDTCHLDDNPANRSRRLDAKRISCFFALTIDLRFGGLHWGTLVGLLAVG
jgi:hypothetical protein